MKLRRFTDNYSQGLIVSVALFTALLLLIIFAGGGIILWLSALVTAVAYVATALLIKKRSIHSYNKRTVSLILGISALLYLTLYYFSGLKYGFYASPKGTLTLASFLTYILPISLIITAGEFIREITVSQKPKFMIFTSYVIGVAIDLAAAGGISTVTSAYKFADYLGMTLFPAMTANLLYVYISKRYGKAPCLIYHLIMTLYVYVIPITPNLPRALPAFILLVLPIGLYAFIKALFEKKPRLARKKKNHIATAFTGIALVLMLCFVLLITCQFRFGMLVIASDSMTGAIDRGDAIVFEAYEDSRPIKENDVIVFMYNDRQTAHRVVEINTVNGERQYITKGDANEGIDPGYRTDSDIVGIVHFKIIYIGYPSLWLREAFNKIK